MIGDYPGDDLQSDDEVADDLVESPVALSPIVDRGLLLSASPEILLWLEDA